MQEVTKKIKSNVQNAVIGMISKFQIRCFHKFDKNIQILASKKRYIQTIPKARIFRFRTPLKIRQPTNEPANVITIDHYSKRFRPERVRFWL